MPDTPLIRSLLLQVGYAESHSMSALLLTHSVGFETARDALGDFAACLREWIAKSRARRLKPCCAKARALVTPSAYCGACGGSLADPAAVTAHDVCEHLRSVHVADCDTLTYDEAEFLSARGWSIGEGLTLPVARITSADYLLGHRVSSCATITVLGREGDAAEGTLDPVAMPAAPAVRPEVGA